jgi:2-polyprenyl-3-methyl-5-hydroxy-6-metoxy-1,4-benzoquinol methylase
MPIDRLTKEIITETDKEERDVSEALNTYINEARASLAFVEPLLARDIRILEIGAGLCVVSLFLKREGFNIIALEPALAGFDFFTSLQENIIRRYNNCDLSILRYPAAKLEEKKIGQFDLIFSFNVIEHIPSPFETLSVLLRVLKGNGQMAHSCPNYLIPYEPHFGIPVLAKWPGLSKFLFNKKLSRQNELWNSLNFITYSEVKRFAKQQNLTIHFTKGLLYHALSRIENDPFFRNRQKNIYIKLLLMLTYSPRIRRQLQNLPPSLATPMNFFIQQSP